MVLHDDIDLAHVSLFAKWPWLSTAASLTYEPTLVRYVCPGESLAIGSENITLEGNIGTISAILPLYLLRESCKFGHQIALILELY